MLLLVAGFNFSVVMLFVDFGFEHHFTNIIVISSYIEAGVGHRSHNADRRVIVDSTKHLVLWYWFAGGETFFDCAFVEYYF